MHTTSSTFSYSSEVAHPRYDEYLKYRHVMACQMVTASTFSVWINQVEEYENGSEVIFEVTSTEAFLKSGWYKNVFAPGHQLLKCHGPYSTRAVLDAWQNED